MRFPKRHPRNPLEDYLDLDFNQFTLSGRGLAGIESVYSIPQWGLTLDTGRAPQFAAFNKYLALTHWHLDHSGSLAHILGVRCLNDHEPLHLVVPDSKVEQTKKYLKVLGEISESSISYKVLKASDTHSLKRGIDLKAIASDHCIDSTGYGVWQTKHRLKPEFEGVPGDELAKKKKQGLVIEENISELLLAYSGDSRAAFFKTEAIRAKVLIMECSFLGEDVPLEKVDYYGHTHMSDWVRYAEQIEAETVVMTHVSQRHSAQQIKEACQKHLPQSLLERLVIFR